MAKPGSEDKHDVLISRAATDHAAALRVAGILREADLSSFVQERDFGAIAFTERNDEGRRAVAGGARVVALLSDAYMASEQCRVEVQQPLIDDPTNAGQRLVLLRIAECAPAGPIEFIPYVDLVPLLDDADAFARAVRGAVLPERSREDAHFASLFRRIDRQIIHAVVQRVTGFTGRTAELAQLESALWTGGAKAALIGQGEGHDAARSPGGTGTSTLAQHYAWTGTGRYSGVWWVRAQTREQIACDIVALGERLIEDLDALPDRSAMAGAALEEIARTGADKPWLLVYDDADGPAVLEGLVPASGVHVIITSRRADWDGAATAIPVGVLPHVEAVAYLQAHAHRPDAAAAGKLADALGCLPLALAQARATSHSMGLDFDAYRARMLDLRQSAPRGAPYPDEVYATIDLALSQAAALAPHAGKLMSAAAYLAPDRIALDIFTADTMSAQERAGAVAALEAVGLVWREMLDDGTHGISLHRIVQAAMRNRLWQIEEARRLRRSQDGDGGERAAIAEAMRLVAQAYPREVTSLDDWLACQRLHDHACSIVAAARRLNDSAITTQALPLARRVLAIEEASYGPDHPAVAHHYATLAALLLDANRPAEADPYIRHAYLTAEKTLGAAHPDTKLYRDSYERMIAVVEEVARHDEAVEAGLAPAPPERLARPDIPPPLPPPGQRGIWRRLLRRSG